MKRLKLALIGAGNIMQTRHLPALVSAGQNRFELVGLVDRTREKCERVARQFGIPQWAVCGESKQFGSIPWLVDAEAVIIATPPKQHAPIVRSCLSLGRHVLVEKPFVTDLAEGRTIIDSAAKGALVLAVNQNFQFSQSFHKLQQLIATGELGMVKSFYCVQFSNDTRRLPVWGDDLPLGLFYDESPHVFYLLRRFGGGDVTVKDVTVVGSTTGKNTPQVLNVAVEVNGLPGTVYCNFESPICEWLFIVFGTRRCGVVDMFRDILTVLPNDGRHLMKEVFTSSFLATAQHWRGFIANGFRYVRHRLHYGTDVTHANFHQAITTGDQRVLWNMTGQDGLKVNATQHAVVSLARQRTARGTVAEPNG
ncbi:MAG TPA: Gfo/Idh/MocA family oxidoreductase [Verrucomicrobiae bacterium]|nr:Gfo/Idh/MocA family oxidoreductase [Verrucomicrobiae bacterium]